MSKTREFPNVVKLLCRIAHTMRENGCYSTVFLALNVPSGIHSDPHNRAEVENTLIPLSSFQGGELFVEAEDGQYKLDSDGTLGNVLPLTLPDTAFWARRRHAVLPWTGDRFVLGLYHVRNPEWLRAEDRSFLSEMGMQLR